VTFNAEILHHGRDIISAQFEQDQPQEYALAPTSKEKHDFSVPDATKIQK
jgi:hypothetical protein